MATKIISVEDLDVDGIAYSFDLVIEYHFDYCDESEYAPATCDLEIESVDFDSAVTYFDEYADACIEVKDEETLNAILESVDVYSLLSKKL